MKFLEFSDLGARRWAWASLIANSLIIVSGALVRLTGSGLGCPTWPQCTDESYLPHGELGIHGAIEFGNRLITFVVAIAVTMAVLAIWRSSLATKRRLTLAIIVALGVPAQVVIGGITVLSDLNPWVVGLHFVASIIMVALSTWLVFDLREDYNGTDASTTRLALLAYVFLSASLYLGTIVTGAGPHAGDLDAVRNGLDPESWSRLHSLAMWAFVATMLVVAWRLRQHAARNRALTVLAVTAAQGGIGYAQYFTGVPVPLVILHLAGATILVIVMTWFLASTLGAKSRVAEDV